MAEPRMLRAMGWNHPRGMGPAWAAAETYHLLNPDVVVLWDTRPLGDFEAFPISQLAKAYDVILFDHPFTGDAADGRWLLPLDEWMEGSQLDAVRHNAIGRTFASYWWNGHQWGLPVDAAAQVMAAGAEDAGDLDVRWHLLWRWASSGRSEPPTGLAVPDHPVHALMLFLALCHRLAGDGFWSRSGIDPVVGETAWAALARLWALSSRHEGSLDPIALMQSLGDSGRGFAPWVFGYVQYARTGCAKTAVTFRGLAPDPDGGGIGSVLGGVGIGVSAFSSSRAAAVRFAAYLASPSVQQGLVLRTGGQPAARAAWIGAASPAFFRDTRITVEAAFVRPRCPGYPAFQAAAAQAVRQGLDEVISPRAMLTALNRLYRKHTKEANHDES